jgi:copper chaperone NosL
MSTRLPFLSRLLTALGAVLMLGAFAFPLWRIDLEAPQYPEGIGMLVRVNTVEGIKPNDLQNINGLNHYIGMREIVPDAIPELRYMPWILGALAAGGLLAALVGRRAALVAWLAAFAVAGTAGLYDFWRWGYEYGHDLDPNAIIKIPDMAYQPPLIGSKQLLNFTAHSWPALGGILLGVAFLLGAVALLVAWRGGRAGRGGAVRTAAAATAAAAAMACAPAEARPIAWGSEPCEYCRMTITDQRFGAEVRTSTGKVLAFDSIECLAGFVAGTDPADVRAVWVSDYERPGTFLGADSAAFWEVGGGVSPMGRGLLATRAGRRPELAPAGARPMRWADVVALVERDTLHAGAGAHAPR